MPVNGLFIYRLKRLDSHNFSDITPGSVPTVANIGNNINPT